MTYGTEVQNDAGQRHRNQCRGTCRSRRGETEERRMTPRFATSEITICAYLMQKAKKKHKKIC